MGKETAWLTQDQIATLFDRDKSVISRHLKNIFKEQELSENSVVAKFATTAADGKSHDTNYYNYIRSDSQKSYSKNKRDAKNGKQIA